MSISVMLKNGILLSCLAAANFACNQTGQATAPPATPLQVTWYDGYKMPGLLQQPATPKTQADIHQLLTQKWYAEFNVASPAEPQATLTISSCDDYFSHNKDGLQTLKQNEAAAFMEIAMMCNATQIISLAKAAPNNGQVGMHAINPNMTGLSDRSQVTQMLLASVNKLHSACRSYDGDILKLFKRQ